MVRDEQYAGEMSYTAEVLYRTDDGRYLVHSIDKHSTDPDDLPDDCFAPARHSGVRFDLGRSIGGSYDLKQASKEELRAGGRFALLGHAAGLWQGQIAPPPAPDMLSVMPPPDIEGWGSRLRWRIEADEPTDPRAEPRYIRGYIRVRHPLEYWWVLAPVRWLYQDKRRSFGHIQEVVPLDRKR